MNYSRPFISICAHCRLSKKKDSGKAQMSNSGVGRWDPTDPEANNDNAQGLDKSQVVAKWD